MSSGLDLHFRLPEPAIAPILDPSFRPAAVAWRAFEQRAQDTGRKSQARFALALGTSTAGGYVTPSGHVTPWLNEIAFVPVDLRPDAPPDEWSGDLGCCVQYLSQQAVGRLLPAAGIDVPPSTPLPQQLKELRESRLVQH